MTYDTQIITAAQVAGGGGQPDVMYRLNVPPYTRYVWNGSSFAELGGASPGIPVMWGPFTASGVIKGTAGDPGTGLAIFCSAGTPNITVRNSATVGGGSTVSPLVTAKAMTAGMMVVFGPVDMPNGIVVDLNSGSGTFYVIGI